MVEAIRDKAFVTSELPLSLSLEMHCSRPQQRRIAKLLREYLGDALLLPEEAAQLVANGVPLSPLALRRRVVVKGKIKMPKAKDAAALGCSADSEADPSSRRSTAVGALVGGTGRRSTWMAFLLGRRTSDRTSGDEPSECGRSGRSGRTTSTGRSTVGRRTSASYKAEEASEARQRAVDEVRARLVAAAAFADAAETDIEAGVAHYSPTESPAESGLDELPETDEDEMSAVVTLTKEPKAKAGEGSRHCSISVKPLSGGRRLNSSARKTPHASALGAAGRWSLGRWSLGRASIRGAGPHDSTAPGKSAKADRKSKKKETGNAPELNELITMPAVPVATFLAHGARGAVAPAAAAEAAGKGSVCIRGTLGASTVGSSITTPRESLAPPRLQHASLAAAGLPPAGVPPAPFDAAPVHERPGMLPITSFSEARITSDLSVTAPSAKKVRVAAISGHQWPSAAISLHTPEPPLAHTRPLEPFPDLPLTFSLPVNTLRFQVGSCQMQRLTARQMIRVYPRNTRFDSANLDPLPCWRAGAQLVALNLQTVDLATQLHHALFAHSGYVLKPKELRGAAMSAAPSLASAPSASGAPSAALQCLWPPWRDEVACVTIRLLSLHHLPTRREARPRLLHGRRAVCHELCAPLSGSPAPPDPSSGASSPRIKVELFSMGGYHQLSRALPPPREGEAPTTSTTTAVVGANGLHAVFDETVYCLASEPAHTVLRVSALDNQGHVLLDSQQEVAFETVVLGMLRPGYRCLELRSRHGTKIELCSLLVHIGHSTVAHPGGESERHESEHHGERHGECLGSTRRGERGTPARPFEETVQLLSTTVDVDAHPFEPSALLPGESVESLRSAVSSVGRLTATRAPSADADVGLVLESDSVRLDVDERTMSMNKPSAPAEPFVPHPPPPVSPPAPPAPLASPPAPPPVDAATSYFLSSVMGTSHDACDANLAGITVESQDFGAETLMKASAQPPQQPPPPSPYQMSPLLPPPPKHVAAQPPPFTSPPKKWHVQTQSVRLTRR